MIVKALTIAGSDPSGGAGIQADLKTFHQFGVYGMSAITLLTVQNTQSVEAVKIIEPSFVDAQISAVLSDLMPQAIKTGALGSEAMIEIVAARLNGLDCPIVVDPVMISKHGASLMDRSAMETLKKKLLPHADLVTPNIDEAEKLSGILFKGNQSLSEMARAILQLGASAVLIKGGHRSDSALDYLLTKNGEELYENEKIQSVHTHGTGCTLSAAITALLAEGNELTSAVRTAKRYITEAISSAPGFGKGSGPVNHFAGIDLDSN